MAESAEYSETVVIARISENWSDPDWIDIELRAMYENSGGYKRGGYTVRPHDLSRDSDAVWAGAQVGDHMRITITKSRTA